MPVSPIPRAYGFLGGSFDPIQKGHIALALAALRERRLAGVYLVPAARSPFKKKGPRASYADRAAMIRKAIRGRPSLKLGSWEKNGPGPSYTFQTLRRLQRRFPGRRWELIVGQDAWNGFHRWRRWREIAARYPIVVGKRRAGGGLSPAGAVFLKTRLPSTSSTGIRAALAQNRSVRRWVDPSVARYIQRRGLY